MSPKYWECQSLINLFLSKFHGMCIITTNCAWYTSYPGRVASLKRSWNHLVMLQRICKDWDKVNLNNSCQDTSQTCAVPQVEPVGIIQLATLLCCRARVPYKMATASIVTSLSPHACTSVLQAGLRCCFCAMKRHNSSVAVRCLHGCPDASVPWRGSTDLSCFDPSKHENSSAWIDAAALLPRYVCSGCCNMS